MIHSAAFRLTLWYLALVMMISASLSVALFRVSSVELAANARRQDPLWNALMRNGPITIQDQRQLELEEARNHLRTNLYLFNAVTLVLGGIASYALARRTLVPIEDAMEAQARFTSDASHELRTPLAVMETELEVALRDPTASAAVLRDTARSTLEEVVKLKLLSEQLLTLSRSGKLEADGDLSVNGAVVEASRRIEPLAAERSITIVNRLPRNDLTVRGNKTSLVEILSILLDNAVKYSDPSTTVTVTAKKDDGRIAIAVADQGAGISPKDVLRIFDRFYRADTARSKTKAGGYGLGLPIARQLAEAQGGTVRAASTPGKGSVFTVLLPAAHLPAA